MNGNSATLEQALGRVQEHSARIVAGDGKVQPGEPLAFSAAATIRDRIAQGDVNLTIVEGVPKDYVLRTNGDIQLAVGNTTGSKHVLNDTSTADVYDPPGWGPTYDGLKGPILVAKSPTKIDHPTHGAVTIPAGFTVECTFQRVYDHELRQERRSAD